MLLASFLTWLKVNESSLKMDDKKLLEMFHVRLCELCGALPLQPLNTQLPKYPTIALNVSAWRQTTFPGGVVILCQEADGRPSPPQAFSRTEFQLIPGDFVVHGARHFPFYATEVYPLFTEQIFNGSSGNAYVLVRNISSKETCV